MTERPALARFLRFLETQEPQSEPWSNMLLDLVSEGCAEDAWFRARKAPAGPDTPAWRAELEAAARRERQKRAALWHLGTGRIHLRLAYARDARIGTLNPSAMQVQLVRTLEAAGFPLALGLEKVPRPLVTAGPPLPLDTEGREEWADVVLARPPALPLAEWTAAFDDAAPFGLTALAFQPVPAYATPVLDLAREAHWTWPCPAPWRAKAEARVAALMAADTFEIEKGGKASGHKVSKRVDIRPQFLWARWEGDTLVFALAILPGEATHPRKLLGGLLDQDPLAITGLVRTRVVLAEDPRLQQADRFEPKLRNMFEDAVALGTGSNITLVDEDEDEPLRLGDPG